MALLRVLLNSAFPTQQNTGISRLIPEASERISIDCPAPDTKGYLIGNPRFLIVSIIEQIHSGSHILLKIKRTIVGIL